MQHTPANTSAVSSAIRRRAAGFTLVEILISLGIFLIGMTAVVSLFPAAAILQRETAQEVISEMASESAEAVINANKLTYANGSGDLGSYHSIVGYSNTEAIPLRLVMGATAFDNRFPQSIRSYPTGLVNGTNIDDCDLHWVPFIQNLSGDSSNPNWVMRLFIVESDSRATYTGIANDANQNDPTNFPKVRGTIVSSVSGSTFTLPGAIAVEPSDLIMDSNGNYHTVTDVTGTAVTVINPIPETPETPTKLYYAPLLDGNNSPAQRVITVEVNVVSP